MLLCVGGRRLPRQNRSIIPYDRRRQRSLGSEVEEMPIYGPLTTYGENLIMESIECCSSKSEELIAACCSGVRVFRTTPADPSGRKEPSIL